MLNESDEATERKIAVGILALLSSITICLAVLWTVSRFYTPYVDTALVKSLFALPPMMFQPEPLERTLFMIGILLMPILLYLFYFLYNKFLQTLLVQPVLIRSRQAACPLLAIMLIGGAFLLFRQNRFFYFEMGIPASMLTFLILGLSGFCFYTLLVKSTEGGRFSFVKIFTERLLYLVLLISYLLVCLFCLVGIESVTDKPIFQHSFNAVFHAVTQVYLGKELLVDLPHQYGLYPHFIEPLFRITGLTVFRFSLLMAFLMGLSLYSLNRFIHAVTTSRMIAALGMICLVYYSYFFGRLQHAPDHYFQYHPIRFLFPAIAVLTTYDYFSTGRKCSYYATFIISSIAVLWNFDTGFVVFASWLLVLIYRECSDWNFRGMMMHVFRGGVALAGAGGGLTAYLLVRYGHLPDYNLMFNYQKQFYLYGFNMIPMPLWHPWILVLLVYVLGLLYSLACLIERRVSSQSSAVFFLSVLGVGIFSYYQGRSHDLNLTAPAYTAILIVTIFADKILQRVRQGGGYGDRMLLFFFLCVTLYVSAGFVKNSPLIAKTINSRLAPVIYKTPSTVSTNAEFVNRNAKPGEKVLILSMHSGVYSLASGTTNNLGIPGITELMLISDYVKIFSWLFESPAYKVFVDRSFEYSFYGQNVLLLLTTYCRLADTSPDGSMNLYIK